MSAGKGVPLIRVKTRGDGAMGSRVFGSINSMRRHIRRLQAIGKPFRVSLVKRSI